MDFKLEKKLADAFPFMRARNMVTDELAVDDETGGYRGKYCECGDGWYALIYQLCGELRDNQIKAGESLEEVRVMQVKEKYGELRFYVYGFAEGSEAIIDKYEKKSRSVCEECGNKGDLSYSGRWIKALCPEHREKYGYNLACFKTYSEIDGCEEVKYDNNNVHSNAEDNDCEEIV